MALSILQTDFTIQLSSRHSDKTTFELFYSNALKKKSNLSYLFFFACPILFVFVFPIVFLCLFEIILKNKVRKIKSPYGV